MARGFGGFNSGGNMNNLMKQAQKMQKDMEKFKEELEDMTTEVTAAGGAVKVIVNGNKQITELLIDPSIVDPEDVETLQDVIIVAVNEAIEKMEEKSSSEMAKITGGFGGIPGF